jgi:hypothetical protein
MLTDYETVLNLCSYVDFMAITNCLTKKFQKKGITLMQVNEEINITLNTIDQFFTVNRTLFVGYWYNYMKNHIESNNGKLYNFKISNADNSTENRTLLFNQELADKMKITLKSRLILHPVADLCDCLDFEQIIGLDEVRVVNFGFDNLFNLVNYINCEVKFPNTKIVLGEIHSEYIKFKTVLRSNFKNENYESRLKYFLNNKDIYPNLVIVLEYINCIIINSVENEKAFSLYTRIKTPSRNKLKTGTTNDHMNINSNENRMPFGEDELLNRSISEWKLDKNRHSY